MRPAVEGKKKRQRAIEEKGKEIGETAGHSREREKNKGDGRTLKGEEACRKPAMPPTRKAPNGAFLSEDISVGRSLFAKAEQFF